MTKNISLPDARELPDVVLEALRVRALRGCEQGWTEAQMAELLGVARETVSRWWSAYREGGLEALPRTRSGRPLGVGRALSDEQAEHIRQLLHTKQPEELDIAAPLWTRPAVQELIRRECQVELAVRTVGKYLKRWGFTPKRPRRRARRQDPEEVRQWVEEEYPALKKRAEEEGAEIHWGDETGVAGDQPPLRGYAPSGEPATLDTSGPHIRMNQISTITNEGKIHFMTYTTTMTGSLFVIFLSRLLRNTSGKVFLIVDRLRAHMTPEVESWVADHSDRLEIFYLPRYAPERNPDEYLNNDLKSQVHQTGLPHNQAEQRTRIQTFMRRLIHLPEHVMSYFQHPYAQYANDIGQ